MAGTSFSPSPTSCSWSPSLSPSWSPSCCVSSPSKKFKKSKFPASTVADAVADAARVCASDDSVTTVASSFLMDATASRTAGDSDFTSVFSSKTIARPVIMRRRFSPAPGDNKFAISISYEG